MSEDDKDQRTTPPGETPDPAHDVAPTKPPPQSNPQVPIQPKPNTV